jgi:hypothetical protein
MRIPTAGTAVLKHATMAHILIDASSVDNGTLSIPLASRSCLCPDKTSEKYVYGGDGGGVCVSVCVCDGGGAVINHHNNAQPWRCNCESAVEG